MASDWQVANLRDLCTLINRGIAPKYIDEGGILVVNQKCIRDQHVSLNEARRHDITEKNVNEERMIQPYDILVNSTGVGTLGRVGQIQELLEPATVDSHVTIVRANPERIHPYFLGFCMRSKQSLIEILAEGSTGQTELSRKHLSELEVAFPGYDDQRAIAHILGTLDDKIELNRRMNETLEAIAKAIFKSWFIDFDPVRAKAEGRDPGLPNQIDDLFPDSFEDSIIGMIPSGWQISSLRDIANIHDARRIPLSKRERAKRQGPYPYYGATSIMDYIDDFIFDGIYILMAEDGSVINADDTPVLQYVWGKFWVNNHAHILEGKNDISNEQLFLILNHLNIRPYITGAVQLKLNQANLFSIPILLPSKSVSHKFQELINPLYSLVRNNSEEIEVLSTMRDELLPELISGEIRIKDVDNILERIT